MLQCSVPSLKMATSNMDLTKLMKPFLLKGITATSKEVGRGAYGRVFEVIYCGTNYAGKEIHSILLDMAGESQVKRIKDHFLRECNLQSRCRHPNIVQFIGIYYPRPDNKIPTMIMELMDISLHIFIEQNRSIPLHSALSISHDVSLGVWYIHSRSPPIIHGDLTPSSVLLNTNSMVAKIKIADFEAALEVRMEDELPRTPDFMPPEALVDKPLYGLPLDVFSYGGVALYAVVGKWPVPSDQVEVDPKTRRRVALSEVERRQQYLDKMIEEAEVLRPLVEECLDNDPARRPTIEIVSERIKVMKKDYMDRHPETKGRKDEIIQQKDQQIQQKNQQLRQQDQWLRQKDKQIQQQAQQLQQKDQQLMEKEQEIQQRDQQLQQQAQQLQQKDQQLREKEQEIQQRDQQLQQQAQQLQQKDQQLREQEQEIRQKDQQLRRQENHGDNPNWVVNRQELRVSEKLLGTGGWGSVREGTFRGCKVAVKCIDNEIISPYNLRLFSREMDMAARCRHPNLMQFIAATDEGIPLIVTELMHTSLRKILQQGQLYSNQIILILLGAAYGLNYLHKTTPNPILHRDISSANVLLNPLPNNQWHAKLSDFGSANFMRVSHTVSAGNPSYAAPEALKPEGPYTPAMDVFSFGVLMYEMCSREFPTEKPNPSMLNSVKWDVTESRLVGMISSCLSHEIQGRPSVDYLIFGLNR